MKGFAMLRIGEVGWIEKPKPVCGPMDAICRPLAAAVCTSDVHTVWEGAVGERKNLILGHECCAEVTEVGALRRIDEYNHVIVMENGLEIPMEDIFDLKAERKSEE